MRDQTKEFIAKFLESHPLEQRKVLDVGSLDVNGSIKGMFSDYTGTDMREGPNVDVVVNGHNLTNKFQDNSFDLVICADTLEHDDKFWLTVEQMRRLVKPGGYMLIGVPSFNCGKHDHPSDYYRFIDPSVRVMFEGFEDIYVEEQKDDPDHKWFDEVYGYGRKV